MIVSSIQNTLPKNNYFGQKNSFAIRNKALLKDEVSFGNKEQKPEKRDAKEINDGINDIDNNSLKTSKSDLNTATDGISIQEFLEKENEALKNQDIDLKHLELDDIDIPKIDIPDLELENLDKDIDKISEEIDKEFKSSMFKSILAELGVGVVIIGAIYYFLKKQKKQNKSLDKQV